MRGGKRAETSNLAALRGLSKMYITYVPGLQDSDRVKDVHHDFQILKDVWDYFEILKDVCYGFEMLKDVCYYSQIGKDMWEC